MTIDQITHFCVIYYFGCWDCNLLVKLQEKLYLFICLLLLLFYNFKLSCLFQTTVKILNPKKTILQLFGLFQNRFANGSTWHQMDGFKKVLVQFFSLAIFACCPGSLPSDIIINIFSCIVSSMLLLWIMDKFARFFVYSFLFWLTFDLNYAQFMLMTINCSKSYSSYNIADLTAVLWSSLFIINF